MSRPRPRFKRYGCRAETCADKWSVLDFAERTASGFRRVSYHASEAEARAEATRLNTPTP